MSRRVDFVWPGQRKNLSRRFAPPQSTNGKGTTCKEERAVSQYQFLTDAQAEQFLNQGYIVLRDAFPRAFAEQWTSHAWERLGFDPDDPATWRKPQIHMPTAHRREWREIAPKAWGAACELVGGEDRL